MSNLYQLTMPDKKESTSSNNNNNRQRRNHQSVDSPTTTRLSSSNNQQQQRDESKESSSYETARSPTSDITIRIRASDSVTEVSDITNDHALKPPPSSSKNSKNLDDSTNSSVPSLPPPSITPSLPPSLPPSVPSLPPPSITDLPPPLTPTTYSTTTTERFRQHDEISMEYSLTESAIHGGLGHDDDDDSSHAFSSLSGSERRASATSRRPTPPLIPPPIMEDAVLVDPPSPPQFVPDQEAPSSSCQATDRPLSSIRANHGSSMASQGGDAVSSSISQSNGTLPPFIFNPTMDAGMEYKQEERPNYGNRRALFLVGLCIVILLLIVVIVVPVVIVTSANNNNDNNTPPPSTMAPTTIEQGVRDFIAKASVDNGRALTDETSPQFEALQFLLDSPSLEFLPRPRLLQRYVLATLFKSTQGDSWFQNDRWMTSANECSWYFNKEDYRACAVDDDALVGMDLRSNNLRGPAPWLEFTILARQLRILRLFENAVTGPLPTEFGRMTELRILDLFENPLGSTLPTELGRLSMLLYLDVDSTGLSGTIPTEIGNWQNLEVLWMNRNDLRGRIPTEIGKFTRIREMYFSENAELSGQIPTEIGALTELQILRLHATNLSGTIPTEIGKLTNLNELRLQGTDLTGSMPQEICDLASLGKLEAECGKVECSCCTNSCV